MNKPRDTSSPESPGSGPTEPGSTAGSSGDPQALDDKRSGRAAHDERGNSVWEWQLETGVYSRDISTQRLKKLDLNDLSIADTASHPRPPGLTEPPGREPSPGGGFNPYDNSSTGGGNVARDPYTKAPYNSAGRDALKPDPVRTRKDSKGPAPRTPADMRKLQEWIELRKRVEQNKLEDGDD
ncbi:MAG: hypothetical protein SXG53_26415 [Pseudomonadota bacterium]|nr:hypothetical protein [Pseudomonadota bacterium]